MNVAFWIRVNVLLAVSPMEIVPLFRDPATTMSVFPEVVVSCTETVLPAFAAVLVVCTRAIAACAGFAENTKQISPRAVKTKSDAVPTVG